MIDEHEDCSTSTIPAANMKVVKQLVGLAGGKLLLQRVQLLHEPFSLLCVVQS